jgi:hypothetical protein
VVCDAHLVTAMTSRQFRGSGYQQTLKRRHLETPSAPEATPNCSNYCNAVQGKPSRSRAALRSGWPSALRRLPAALTLARSTTFATINLVGGAPGHPWKLFEGLPTTCQDGSRGTRRNWHTLGPVDRPQPSLAEIEWNGAMIGELRRRSPDAQDASLFGAGFGHCSNT